MPAPCSLSILVARTDLGFMRHTIPHLVRTCDYPFRERALVIDSAPLGSAYLGRPGVGTQDELVACAESLLQAGHVDRLHHIDYRPLTRDTISRKYFGRSLRETHDFRGYPVHGTVQALEVAPTDFVVHFDSDMLLHQAKDFSWIERGCHLIENNPDIAFVAPLSGPPTEDLRIHQKDTPYTVDPRGFFRFPFFTSRKFLVSRRRLLGHGPIRPWWISRKRKWLSRLTRRSAIWSFEMMATRHLELHRMCRADLRDARAWTLHTPDHGPAFLSAVPSLIEQVEAGKYPPNQAGHFDLRMNEWNLS